MLKKLEFRAPLVHLILIVAAIAVMIFLLQGEVSMEHKQSFSIVLGALIAAVVGWVNSLLSVINSEDGRKREERARVAAEILRDLRELSSLSVVSSEDEASKIARRFAIVDSNIALAIDLGTASSDVDRYAELAYGFVVQIAKGDVDFVQRSAELSEVFNSLEKRMGKE